MSTSLSAAEFADLDFEIFSETFAFKLSQLVKRCSDLGLVIIGLILISPVFLIIAIIIAVSSPGPILYGSLRTGRNGVPFTMYKFRTMHVDADQRWASLREKEKLDKNELFKLKQDPRVTPVGEFLRGSSLDELPQLFNVLMGHMSLVGPRPFIPEECALFQHPYTLRFEVLPGMTGIWQVSGRSNVSFQTMCELDLEYVLRWNLLTDFMILLRTFPAVLLKHGAY